MSLAVPETSVDRPALRALAAHAQAQLDGAPAQAILRWAIERFSPRFAIASSMESGVLSHMAAEIRPGVPVLFLDTGYHFPETIGTRDAIAATYDVTLLTIGPVRTVAQQDAEFGPRLYERDPDLCCAMRKVAPLDDALDSYDAWASGIRRDELETRREIDVVAWDDRREMVKVNPLAGWTQDDVEAYIAKHDILVNPLMSEGYPSIGCGPCTRRVAPGEDPRSGRWAGTGKVECGLHV